MYSVYWSKSDLSRPKIWDIRCLSSRVILGSWNRVLIGSPGIVWKMMKFRVRIIKNTMKALITRLRMYLRSLMLLSSSKWKKTRTPA